MEGSDLQQRSRRMQCCSAGATLEQWDLGTNEQVAEYPEKERAGGEVILTLGRFSKTLPNVTPPSEKRGRSGRGV